MNSEAWFLIFAFAVIILAAVLILRNKDSLDQPGIGEPFRSIEEEEKEKEEYEKKYPNKSK